MTDKKAEPERDPAPPPDEVAPSSAETFRLAARRYSRLRARMPR